MTTRSQLKARLEKEIEAEVIRRFPEIIQLKTHVKYWPDRIFFLPGGKTIFMEFKVPGEKLTPGQQAAAVQLERLGFPCYGVYSAGTAMQILGSELRERARLVPFDFQTL